MVQQILVDDGNILFFIQTKYIDFSLKTIFFYSTLRTSISASYTIFYLLEKFQIQNVSDFREPKIEEEETVNSFLSKLLDLYRAVECTIVPT